MKMSDDCQLKTHNQCCCTCRYHIIDRSHPGTDGKPAYNTRGYICAEPFLGFCSGWSEHGLCECWTERPERPNPVLNDPNDPNWPEVEHWDAMYSKRDAYPSYIKLKF